MEDAGDLVPRAAYSRRLGERRAAASALSRREDRIVWARGTLGLAALALAVWIWRTPGTAWWWMGVPAAVFFAVAFAHDRVLRAVARTGRASRFYEAGIERLEERWHGHGATGERFRDEHHPYALDLDLFGVGSLFQRMSAARTEAGEAALASWLLSPADGATIRERQSAVAELRAKLDLREDLALLGEETLAEIRPEALRAWGAEPRILAGGAAQIGLLSLTAAVVASLFGWWLSGIGPVPFLVLAAAQSVAAWRLRARVLRVESATDRPARDLELLAEVLARFEREGFESEGLVRLRRDLDTDGRPPSAAIRRLARLVDLRDAPRNQLFMPVALLTAWRTHVACALEAWRARHGAAVTRWVEAAAELEALASLAGYAFENPGDPFPEIVEGEPVFEATGLGHPLIPEAACVRNDVCLGGERRLLVVSGSNMSGKSTLLRSVGINAVLALAGAPVRARSLRLSPLSVGATLRIQDSLREGASRFYAEISRLRQIVDLTRGERPVLFLLDEILHGTNSHDRAIGSEGVLRGLLDRRAIGLVTTHDLALASLADRLAPRGANVHFEDRLEDGKMLFDYRMREGVVRTSNALALMRSVGLEV